MAPSGPNPASYNLTVTSPVQPQPPLGQPQPPPSAKPPFQAGEELPIGIAGVIYDHQLITQGAKGLTTFQLVFGELPPGLRLSPRGKITGIPTLEGEFPFRLKISDQSGQSIEQQYLLIVGQAVLSVTVDPVQQTIARNREGTYELRYNFTSTEPVDDTLRSTQGIFYAGNRKVGVSNTNLTASMRKGRAQVLERVVVPLSILQMVQRGGLSEIRYERVFSAVYMKAQTTSSIVIPVGIGFTITELRIYFGNNQGKTTVKRNERDIEAFVDIRYEGAGTLEGYWEADGRILKTITKDLMYARDKVVTLGLLDMPKGPPLPTYSFGSRRLRFVITKPRLNITFPEAIYMVSSEGLAEQFPIVLDAPADNARLDPAELQFSWQEKRGITTYLIEFYSNKDEPPIFSGYTRTAGYSVPKMLADRYFTKQGNYWWKVSGYNVDEELAAQSRVFLFSFFNGDETDSE